jgi:hypothetical protein
VEAASELQEAETALMTALATVNSSLNSSRFVISFRRNLSGNCHLMQIDTSFDPFHACSI